MQAGATLAAWSTDRAAQAHSEQRSAALAARWRTGDAARAMAAAVDGTFAAIDALVADPSWLTALLDPLIGGLAGDHWFQPPVAIGGDDHRSALLLARGRAGSIALSVVRPEGADPMIATAGGRMQTIRIVRAGGAALELRCGRHLSVRPLVDGQVLRIDGRTIAHAIIGQRGSFAMLVGASVPDAGASVRAFDRATGALASVTGLDESVARGQLLLEMLRASDHPDAPICLAEISQSDPPSLRWEAMREWLVVEPGLALPRLAEMASGDPDSGLRDAASATLAAIARRAPCHA